MKKQQGQQGENSEESFVRRNPEDMGQALVQIKKDWRNPVSGIYVKEQLVCIKQAKYLGFYLGQGASMSCTLKLRWSFSKYRMISVDIQLLNMQISTPEEWGTTHDKGIFFSLIKMYVCT